ncbi:hypothetical protein MTR_7g105210 [Medicago truncatula]|uniref:Uncharacterized protein n=1 Tax=Medicago truncatula TaxID=3880 RepID=A0A072U4T0_MEDTR|nr:hypothetical protein MTR_7g105210 [Medicago truncatula]
MGAISLFDFRLQVIVTVQLMLPLNFNPLSSSKKDNIIPILELLCKQCCCLAGIKLNEEKIKHIKWFSDVFDAAMNGLPMVVRDVG